MNINFNLIHYIYEIFNQFKTMLKIYLIYIKTFCTGNIFMQGSQEKIYDFVIVGAGIAGLQTGIILAKHQKSFIILEASSEIGGRIATERIEDIIKKQRQNKNLQDIYVEEAPDWIKQNPTVLNVPIEYGATWVADSNQYMFRLLKQHNIETYPQFREGNYVFGVQPGKFESLKSFGQLYEQEDKQQIQKMLNSIHKLKNKYQQLYEKGVQKNYTDKVQQFNSFVDKYDTMSVQQYIRSQIKDNQLVGELLNFIQCLQCIDCNKFSMLQLLDDDDSLQIINQVVDKLDQSDDGYRVKLGLKTLLQSMYRQVNQSVRNQMSHLKQEEFDIIRFNEPVVRIDSWEKNQKQCKVFTRGWFGQRIYTAKRVLNSIPLATMGNVQISNLSIGKQILYKGQEMGIVHRIFMVFKEPFWRKLYNGYGLFSSHFPFNQITQLSPANLSCGIFAFVFYANKYEKWIRQNPNPKQRFRYLLDIVADMYLKGDRQSHYLKDCFAYTRSFTDNQYIKAGYQPTTKMGVWKAIKDAGEDYEQTFESDQNGIYNIGSQFDNDYGSYMQGAVRIARKKVYQLLSKPDPWKK